MGCWNGTCGISQIPITAGERVACFFLKHNKHSDNGGSGFCYSDNQYCPITMPIFGEYDDYGCVEKIDKNGDFVLEHIQKLVKKGDLIIQCDRFGMQKNEINSYETLFELLHDSLIVTKQNEVIGFMLVLEDIYNELINEIGNNDCSNTYLKYKPMLKHSALQLTTFFIDNRKKLQEIENKIKELEENDPDSKEISQLNDEKIISFFEIKITTGENDFQFKFDNYRKYELKYYLEKVIITGDIEMIDAMVDFCLFDEAIELGRKMWTPQCGAGSQSRCYSIHKIIATSILKKIEQVKQEYISDNDCTEEEAEEFLREY
jgi:hypothetical protein